MTAGAASPQIRNCTTSPSEKGKGAKKKRNILSHKAIQGYLLVGRANVAAHSQCCQLAIFCSTFIKITCRLSFFGADFTH